MLAAFAVWGLQATDNTVVNVLMGVATPIAAAVVWGTFLAPKRRIDLAVPVRVVMELVVFGLAVLALAAAGQSTLAVVLAVVAVAQRGTLSALGDHSPRVSQ